jgi:photoactive yellow protein
MTVLPDFDTPALARAVEALSEASIDALPFGVIRLAANGAVQFYSQGEARLSGRGSRPVLGQNYFTEIAPCFANDDYLLRIERAQAEGRLDIEFGIVGDFDNAEKELRVRVQSASQGGIWIFTHRL